MEFSRPSRAPSAGQGAGQAQAVQRGYELLGRYLGVFHDQLEVSADQTIIEQLNRGRRYAAGLTDQEDEEPQDDSVEPKPN